MAVRLEKVVLELDDGGFSTQMAKNAAATSLLERSLRSLDGTTARTGATTDSTSESVGGLGKSTGTTTARTKEYTLAMAVAEERSSRLRKSLREQAKAQIDAEGGSVLAAEAVETLGRNSGRSGREIDRFSGRLRLLADTAAIIGPALVPIGALAVPAVAGLAAQFGAAAIGAGTAVVAFQGVGDALEAVDNAAIEPTVANLEAAQVAMENLAPQAQAFVRELQAMRPVFEGLRDSAAAGLFPGLVESLRDVEEIAPRLERVLTAVGNAAGDLAADFSEGLAGPRGREFLAFVRTEVPLALTDLGHIVANFAAGMAELWMAFTPLNQEFSAWMLEASESFDRWAQGLSETQGFREFVAYIQENGPRVADALGAMGNAVLQIVEAAAPLGGPVLQALESVADVIAKIADSDAGPAIMATVTSLALLNRGMAAFSAAGRSAWIAPIKGAETFGAKMSAARGPLLKGGAAMAGLGLAASGAANGFGLSNTASLALMGTLAGPWGAAIGGAVGLALDFAASQDEAAVKAMDLAGTLDQQTGAITKNTRATVAAGLEQAGVLEKAQSLGVDLKLVTKAALGNADAMDRLAQMQRAATEESERLNASTAEGFTNTQAQILENRANVLGEITSALGLQSAETSKATAAAQRQAAAVDGAAGSYKQAASAADAFRRSLIRVNEILTGRANLRSYEQALDDLTKSVKQNGRTLDITTQKGRDNQAALDDIASSALAVAENMRGTNRIDFLQRARQDMIDAARKLGLTRAEAQALADKLGLVDGMRVNPQIQADTARAEGNVRNLLNALAQIRDRTVTVTTVFTESGRRFKDFDSGGFTGPGHRLEPRGVVHAGEVVIPQNLVKRDWSMLSSRYGHLPGFAGGGMVGNTYASTRNLPVDSATRSLARFDAALVESSRGLRSELTQRLESASKIRDAEKARLDSLKDQQKALVESVQALYRGEVFGRSADFGDAPVSAEFRQAAAVTTARNVLTREIAEAREAFGLLRELRQKGFDGPLFRELAASGDVLALRGFADLSRRELREYENLYSQRQRVSTRAGEMAGRDLQPAIDRQVAEVRETNREIRALRSEVAQMRRQDKDAPERTGREVGEVINKAARAGVKGRGR